MNSKGILQTGIKNEKFKEVIIQLSSISRLVNHLMTKYKLSINQKKRNLKNLVH